MKMAKFFLIVFSLILIGQWSYGQKKQAQPLIDSTKNKTIKPKGIAVVDSLAKKDSFAVKKHDPAKATLYAAIFPGLGQIYNKKYWKLPLVYAAVGIPTYEFIHNRSNYNKYRYALSVLTNGQFNNQAATSKIDPKIYRDMVSFLQTSDSTTLAAGLMIVRNQYRQWEDYSVLFFLLFYALQIVDATVDAHLKEFNVSSDLSFHFQPAGASPGPNPGGMGLSVVFNIHPPKAKPLFNIYQ
jgi:hypothetical protein